MLAHIKKLLEYGTGGIAIHPQKHGKLITSLRTAVADEWSLDKEVTLHDDLFEPIFYNSVLLLGRKLLTLSDTKAFSHYKITDEGLRYLQLFNEIEDYLEP